MKQAATCLRSERRRLSSVSRMSCTRSRPSTDVQWDRLHRPPGVFGTSNRAAPSLVWGTGNEQALCDVLELIWDRSRPSLFITHNGLNFDLPFIKNGRSSTKSNPACGINSGQVPRRAVYDTMADLEQLDNR